MLEVGLGSTHEDVGGQNSDSQTGDTIVGTSIDGSGRSRGATGVARGWSGGSDSAAGRRASNRGRGSDRGNSGAKSDFSRVNEEVG